MTQRVIIVGGGLAGIATAVRLAEHDVPVTVVETRKRLGGRATSFVDPSTGQLLDNCQHVVMRCCTSLLDLYDRLGVADAIEWHRELYFASRSGDDLNIDRFRADKLPAPVHLTRSLLMMRMLTLSEKRAISRATFAIMRTDRQGLDDKSFAEWLDEHRQPPGAVKKYWELVVVSACNESLDRVSAKYALQVFQEGFLHHVDAYEMGLAEVPLVELYDPAERLLEKAGGRLHLACGADGFVYGGGRVAKLRLNGRRELPGEWFVSAVPFDRLLKLVTEEMLDADARLRHLDQVDVSPIIGIHLMVSGSGGGSVMELPHLILTGSPIQWVFNKGFRKGAVPGVQHLHCVISAAHDLVGASSAELIELALGEVRRLVPGAADAQLVHGRAIKEKRATFSVAPGTDRVRPGPVGDVENLILAGDWTDTGWPATMEGATRSGYRAAEAVLTGMGITPREPMTIPDLDSGVLYRMIARA